VFFIVKMRQYSIYSSNAICQIYVVNHPINFDLVSSCSVDNIFRNLLHDIDHRFKMHISVRAIVVIWSLWLCEMIKCLTIKNPHFCRLFIYVPILSVYSYLYIIWRIETYL
jgi:hypothetical protein